MASGSTGTQGAAAQSSDDVGAQLRAARESQGLSLRELARRLELSASALSQIETGKSLPSVKTLYAIVSELDLSLDALFDAGRPRPAGQVPDARAASPDAPGSGPVQRSDSRAALELDSGVRWERLTAAHDPEVDFMETTYDVGGSSSSSGQLVRHSGREYGVVLEGELEVTVGFESYSLGSGDSVSFNSDEPHVLRNVGSVPAKTIWFVIGRRGSDPRQPRFEHGPTADDRS